MWLFISTMLRAHTPLNDEWNHSFLLGYQYRTLVSEEPFVSPHCSVLQYRSVFIFSNDRELTAFMEPSISVIGLNQSVLQPSASLVVGFKLGSRFKIGSGPIISIRDNIDETIFPQLVIEASYVLHVFQNMIPIKFGYVPMSYGLTQYQLLLGYTWK